MYTSHASLTALHSERSLQPGASDLWSASRLRLRPPNFACASHHGLPGTSCRSIRRRRTKLGLTKPVGRPLADIVTRDELKELIDNSNDDNAVARILQRRHSIPSLSPLTVRALRLKYGIHRRHVATEAQVREAVQSAIDELGPFTGRSYIAGHARAVFKHSIGTKRINKMAAELAPQDHRDRTIQPRGKMRTKPFRTFYFGDTLSIDQNEKLAMLVSFISPTVQLRIFSHVYGFGNCVAVEEHGLFHRVLCDNGTENHLVCFVQEHILRPFVPRSSPHSKVVNRVSSVHNVRIEYIWGDVNRRVSETVRWSLDYLRQIGVIDLDNPVHIYCVSTMTVQVVQAMLDNFVRAYNEHHVSRVGIPNKIHEEQDGTTRLPPRVLPTVTAALEQYEQVSGRPLTIEGDAGHDPLAGNAHASALRDAGLAHFRTADIVKDLQASMAGHLASDPVPSPLFCSLIRETIRLTEHLSPREQ
ncbi:hypothetical protein BCR44DRAFT_27171 [Catenaria anguillulae PL171]|uniref:Integrase core domain-containing protein n=1 Tax=Catenaria anguillulae PL171 TaxID=765915 RepID=A0A1Y2HHN4_9FUNG|nr:hypothetical protein BCR44DRAFT_27171 [Catenaria anguillulae PL171]